MDNNLDKVDHKKVLLLGFFNEDFMPFMKDYEEILVEQQCTYEKIFFDRNDNGAPTFLNNTITFKSNLGKGVGSSKYKKIIPYFNYFIFVNNLINSRNYEKLIVLTTTPAMLLGLLLLRKYTNSFIFDYRDKTYCERFWLYRKFLNYLITKSYATFISSEGFLDYSIDRNNRVQVVHNISNMESKRREFSGFQNPINIGFIGAIRYFDVNTKLIKAFANNPNYCLTYSGIIHDDCDLPGFCKQECINNVHFTGPFRNLEKPELYKNIQVINAIYSITSPDVLRAVPNKIYDAIIFKIPIIVAKGTFLSEIVSEFSLGTSIDSLGSPENFAIEIQDYINSFDKNKFELGCIAFMKKINSDMEKFKQKLRVFIND